MKKVGVITDSHSSISQQLAAELGIFVLPMPFSIDGVTYYEDVTLTREEFFKKLDSSANISTSQPSPTQVMELWDRTLSEYEQVLYIPISSGLSGSCSTAYSMASEEPYEGRVFVVDNGRVSTLMHRSVLDALELIEEGYSAGEIKALLEQSRSDMSIYVGVQTLEHLKKGGRISPAAAALASVLNIKPILKFDVGILEPFKKCRGFGKAKKAMLEALQHDLDTRFHEQALRGEIYLLAASSASREETDQWIEEIHQAFPGMDLLCDDLSLGVSCHIGEGGLGIGLSCRPVRSFPPKKP